MSSKRRVPIWMACVIIVAMLPVLLYPAMLSDSVSQDTENRMMIWFYPAYVLIAGYLAWQCYGRRTYMSWILIILLILSHIAMWLLTTGSYVA